ncbi:MAG: flippase [Microcoleaceae cyanobacterium MO_207.B10]|nr:flippase [Microcoleaceae cyanobacterium MO_207.B10]
MLNSLAKGAGIAFLIRVFGVGIKYFLEICLARWMGAVEFGIYEYVISWTMVLAIFAQLGLPTANLRFISEYKVRSQWGSLRGLLRSSWQLILIAGLFLSIVATGIILWLKATYNFAYSIPLLTGILLIPLLALIQLQLEMARAIRKIVLAYAPFQIFWPILVFLGALFFLANNQQITSILIIAWSVISLFIILVFQFFLLRRKFDAEIYSVKAIYKTDEWIKVALPLLLGTTFLMLLNQTDILMIGGMINSEAVGIYSAAAKTAIWVIFILQAVNTVIAPVFTTVYTQGNREELKKLVATIAHWIFWPSLVVAIFMIIFAEEILGFFGPEFRAAQWEMIILVIGNLVNAGTGSVGWLMIMTGHQNQCTLIFGFSAMINLVLNLILIPNFGTLGAAIATAITMIMWNILLHILVVKYLNVYPGIVYNLLRK